MTTAPVLASHAALVLGSPTEPYLRLGLTYVPLDRALPTAPSFRIDHAARSFRVDVVPRSLDPRAAAGVLGWFPREGAPDATLALATWALGLGYQGNALPFQGAALYTADLAGQTDPYEALLATAPDQPVELLWQAGVYAKRAALIEASLLRVFPAGLVPVVTSSARGFGRRRIYTFQPDAPVTVDLYACTRVAGTWSCPLVRHPDTAPCPVSSVLTPSSLAVVLRITNPS